MHAVPFEECLGILCILVKGSGGLNIEVAVEEIQDVAVFSVLLYEFGGDEADIVRLGDLSI